MRTATNIAADGRSMPTARPGRGAGLLSERRERFVACIRPGPSRRPARNQSYKVMREMPIFFAASSAVILLLVPEDSFWNDAADLQAIFDPLLECLARFALIARPFSIVPRRSPKLVVP